MASSVTLPGRGTAATPPRILTARLARFPLQPSFSGGRRRRNNGAQARPAWQPLRCVVALSATSMGYEDSVAREKRHA